jgi:hypothetical protein
MYNSNQTTLIAREPEMSINSRQFSTKSAQKVQKSYQKLQKSYQKWPESYQYLQKLRLQLNRQSALSPILHLSHSPLHSLPFSASLRLCGEAAVPGQFSTVFDFFPRLFTV